MKSTEKEDDVILFSDLLEKKTDTNERDIQVTPNENEDYFEFTSPGINNIIENLTRQMNLGLPQEHQTETELLNPNIELLPNPQGWESPEHWWHNGISCAYPWLQQCFLYEMCQQANMFLKQHQITFFEWKGIYNDVTMDAMSCSFARLLQSTTEDQLKKIQDQVSTLEKQIQTLNGRSLEIISVFQSDSTSTAHQNPSLSEILRQISLSLQYVLSLRQNFYLVLTKFYEKQRQIGVVMIETLKIIHVWLLQAIKEKLHKKLTFYVEKKRQSETTFQSPSHELIDRGQRLYTFWNLLQERYKLFLTTIGFREEESAVCNALKIMNSINDKATFSRNESSFVSLQQFTSAKEAVYILCNCVTHVKQLFETEKSNHTSHFLNYLQQTYDKYRTELDQLRIEHTLQNADNHDKQNEIPIPDDLLDQLVHDKKAISTPNNSQDDRQKKLENSLQRLSEVIEKYKNSPSNIHNQWMVALNQLQKFCNDSIQQWETIYNKKLQYDAILEEETRNALDYLMKYIHSSYHYYLGEIDTDWTNRLEQQKTIKKEHEKRVYSETKLVNEWLNSFERKLVLYHADIYNAKINEFKTIQNTIDTLSCTCFKQRQFLAYYDSLVKIWNLIYADCPKYKPQ